MNEQKSIVVGLILLVIAFSAVFIAVSPSYRNNLRNFLGFMEKNESKSEEKEEAFVSASEEKIKQFNEFVDALQDKMQEDEDAKNISLSYNKVKSEYFDGNLEGYSIRFEDDRLKLLKKEASVSQRKIIKEKISGIETYYSFKGVINFDQNLVMQNYELLTIGGEECYEKLSSEWHIKKSGKEPTSAIQADKIKLRECKEVRLELAKNEYNRENVIKNLFEEIEDFFSNNNMKGLVVKLSEQFEKFELSKTDDNNLKITYRLKSDKEVEDETEENGKTDEERVIDINRNNLNIKESEKGNLHTALEIVRNCSDDNNVLIDFNQPDYKSGIRFDDQYLYEIHSERCSGSLDELNDDIKRINQIPDDENIEYALWKPKIKADETIKIKDNDFHIILESDSRRFEQYSNKLVRKANVSFGNDLTYPNNDKKIKISKYYFSEESCFEKDERDNPDFHFSLSSSSIEGGYQEVGGYLGEESPKCKDVGHAIKIIKEVLEDNNINKGEIDSAEQFFNAVEKMEFNVLKRDPQTKIIVDFRYSDDIELNSKPNVYPFAGMIIKYPEATNPYSVNIGEVIQFYKDTWKVQTSGELLIESIEKDQPVVLSVEEKAGERKLTLELDTGLSGLMRFLNGYTNSYEVHMPYSNYEWIDYDSDFKNNYEERKFKSRLDSSGEIEAYNAVSNEVIIYGKISWKTLEQSKDSINFTEKGNKVKIQESYKGGWQSRDETWIDIILTRCLNKSNTNEDIVYMCSRFEGAQESAQCKPHQDCLSIPEYYAKKGFERLIDDLEEEISKINNDKANAPGKQIKLNYNEIKKEYFYGNLEGYEIKFSSGKAELVNEENNKVVLSEEIGVSTLVIADGTEETYLFDRNSVLKNYLVEESAIYGPCYRKVTDKWAAEYDSSPNKEAISVAEVESSLFNCKDVITKASIEEITKAMKEFFNNKKTKALVIFLNKDAPNLELMISDTTLMSDLGFFYTDQKSLVSKDINELGFIAQPTGQSYLVLLRNCSNPSGAATVDFIGEDEAEFNNLKTKLEEIREARNVAPNVFHNEMCSDSLDNLNEYIDCVNKEIQIEDNDYIIVKFGIEEDEKANINEEQKHFNLTSSLRYYPQFSKQMQMDEDIKINGDEGLIEAGKDDKIKFSRYYFENSKECYQKDDSSIYLSKTEESLEGNCNPFKGELSSIYNKKCEDVGNAIPLIKEALEGKGRQVINTDEFLNALETLGYDGKGSGLVAKFITSEVSTPYPIEKVAILNEENVDLLNSEETEVITRVVEPTQSTTIKFLRGDYKAIEITNRDTIDILYSDKVALDLKQVNDESVLIINFKGEKTAWDIAMTYFDKFVGGLKSEIEKGENNDKPMDIVLDYNLINKRYFKGILNVFNVFMANGKITLEGEENKVYLKKIGVESTSEYNLKEIFGLRNYIISLTHNKPCNEMIDSWRVITEDRYQHIEDAIKTIKSISIAECKYIDGFYTFIEALNSTIEANEYSHEAINITLNYNKAVEEYFFGNFEEYEIKFMNKKANLLFYSKEYSTGTNFIAQSNYGEKLANGFDFNYHTLLRNYMIENDDDDNKRCYRKTDEGNWVIDVISEPTATAIHSGPTNIKSCAEVQKEIMINDIVNKVEAFFAEDDWKVLVINMTEETPRLSLTTFDKVNNPDDFSLNGKIIKTNGVKDIILKRAGNSGFLIFLRNCSYSRENVVIDYVSKLADKEEYNSLNNKIISIRGSEGKVNQVFYHETCLDTISNINARIDCVNDYLGTEDYTIVKWPSKKEGESVSLMKGDKQFVVNSDDRYYSQYSKEFSRPLETKRDSNLFSGTEVKRLLFTKYNFSTEYECYEKDEDFIFVDSTQQHMEGNTCYTADATSLSPINPKCDEVGLAIKKIKNVLAQNNFVNKVTIERAEFFFKALNFIEKPWSNKLNVKYSNGEEKSYWLYSEPIILYPTLGGVTEEYVLEMGKKANFLSETLIIEIYDEGEIVTGIDPSSKVHIEKKYEKEKDLWRIEIRFEEGKEKQVIDEERLKEGFKEFITKLSNLAYSHTDEPTFFSLSLNNIAEEYFKEDKELFEDGTLMIEFSNQKATLKYQYLNNGGVITSRDSYYIHADETHILTNNPLIIGNFDLSEKNSNKYCYTPINWKIGGGQVTDTELGEIDNKKTTTTLYGIQIDKYSLPKCSELIKEQDVESFINEINNFFANKNRKAGIFFNEKGHLGGVFEKYGNSLIYLSKEGKSFNINTKGQNVNIKEGNVQKGGILKLVRNCSSDSNNVILDVVASSEAENSNLREYFDSKDGVVQYESCSASLGNINDGINCANGLLNGEKDYALINLKVEKTEKLTIQPYWNKFKLTSTNRYFPQYSNKLKKPIGKIIMKAQNSKSYYSLSDLAIEENKRIKISKRYIDEAGGVLKGNDNYFYITDLRATSGLACEYWDEKEPEESKTITTIKNIIENGGSAEINTKDFFNTIDNIEYNKAENEDQPEFSVFFKGNNGDAQTSPGVETSGIKYVRIIYQKENGQYERKVIELDNSETIFDLSSTSTFYRIQIIPGSVNDFANSEKIVLKRQGDTITMNFMGEESEFYQIRKSFSSFVSDLNGKLSDYSDDVMSIIIDHDKVNEVYFNGNLGHLTITFKNNMVDLSSGTTHIMTVGLDLASEKNYVLSKNNNIIISNFETRTEKKSDGTDIECYDKLQKWKIISYDNSRIKREKPFWVIESHMDNCEKIGGEDKTEELGESISEFFNNNWKALIIKIDDDTPKFTINFDYSMKGFSIRYGDFNYGITGQETIILKDFNNNVRIIEKPAGEYFLLFLRECSYQNQHGEVIVDLIDANEDEYTKLKNHIDSIITTEYTPIYYHEKCSPTLDAINARISCVEDNLWNSDYTIVKWPGRENGESISLMEGNEQFVVDSDYRFYPQYSKKMRTPWATQGEESSILSSGNVLLFSKYFQQEGCYAQGNSNIYITPTSLDMVGNTCYTADDASLSPIKPKCSEVGDAISKIKSLLDNGGEITMGIQKFFKAVDYFESAYPNNKLEFGVKFVGGEEINQELYISSEEINSVIIDYPTSDKIFLRRKTDTQQQVRIDLKESMYNIEFNNGQNPIASIPASGYVTLNIEGNKLIMEFDQVGTINQELKDSFAQLITDIKDAENNNENYATRIILDLNSIKSQYFSGHENLFDERGQLGQLKIVFLNKKAALRYYLNGEIYELARGSTGINAEGEVVLTGNIPTVIRNHNLNSASECYIKEDWAIGGVYNNDQEIEFKKDEYNGLTIETNKELEECSKEIQKEIDTAVLDALDKFFNDKNIKAFVGYASEAFPKGSFRVVSQGGGLMYSSGENLYELQTSDNIVNILDGEVSETGSLLVLVRNCSQGDEDVILTVLEKGEGGHEEIKEHFDLKGNNELAYEGCSETLSDINKRINDNECINYIEDEDTYNFTLVKFPIPSDEQLIIRNGEEIFELESNDKYFTQFSDKLESKIKLADGNREAVFSGETKLKFSKYYYDKDNECYEYDLDSLFVSETTHSMEGSCDIPWFANIDEPKCMAVGDVISKIKDILANGGGEILKTEQVFNAIKSLEYTNPIDDPGWALGLYLRNQEEKTPTKYKINKIVIEDIEGERREIDFGTEEIVLEFLEKTYIIELVQGVKASEQILNIDDDGNVLFKVSKDEVGKRVLTMDFRKRDINTFKAFVDEAGELVKETGQIIIAPYTWVITNWNSLQTRLMLNIFDMRLKQDLNKNKMVNLKFQEMLKNVNVKETKIKLERTGDITLFVEENEYPLFTENNDKTYLIFISEPVENPVISPCINFYQSEGFCLEGIAEFKEEFQGKCEIPISIKQDEMEFSETIQNGFCGNKDTIPAYGLIAWSFKNFYMKKIQYGGESVLFMVASTKDVVEDKLNAMLESYVGDITYLKNADYELFNNEK